MNEYKPLFDNLDFMLHGADYNPDQWIDSPEILIKDINMMKEAKCNIMSVGIFSWSALEPHEGVYIFEWLDNVINSLYDNGISVFLATPSGARPAWMSQKYPEVLRVSNNRVNALHGGRHNHCLTSPIYRNKVKKINQLLSERYSNHPAIVGWHVSNEYGGECHCELCQQAFRGWLQERYNSLDLLNKTWWTSFWSHTFTDWNQIESPSIIGEHQLHGLNLDWRRFVTDQVKDFCIQEIAPLKKNNPSLPVTTNFMRYFYDYDYWKLSEPLDFISWDSYPVWHSKDDIFTAAYTAMFHDLMRTLKKGKPFILMESTPSVTNWHPVCKLKRPGMHILSSLQAIAHGADSVQYFQWRKSRGSSEKFHGAVVDHVGHLNTRVGKEVTALGKILAKLNIVTGSRIKSDVAIIYDWENRWAMEDALGPRNLGLDYDNTVVEHYKPFWQRGVSVDIINSECDFTPYRLIVVPMLYMVRPGVSEHLHEFVKQGGRIIVTYWSGIVNENDLCYLNGFPGPLRPLLGIWAEEIDSLADEEFNEIIGLENNSLGLSDGYKVKHLCEIIHLEGAEALAVYGVDFYKGSPAVTVNKFGEGLAYYIASRNDESFHQDFIDAIIKEMDLKTSISSPMPNGVTAQRRQNATFEFIFIQNYNAEVKCMHLDEKWKDLVTEEIVQGEITLSGYECRVLYKNI